MNASCGVLDFTQQEPPEFKTQNLNLGGCKVDCQQTINPIVRTVPFYNAYNIIHTKRRGTEMPRPNVQVVGVPQYRQKWITVPRLRMETVISPLVYMYYKFPTLRTYKKKHNASFTKKSDRTLV